MELSGWSDRIRRGEQLTCDEMESAIGAMIEGRCQDFEMGEFLLALRGRGETIDELVGAATALRRHMVRIRSSREGVLDTCGTGGDAARTFNISTAAALVTAAAGVPVAKHGNRKITSNTGSADVLLELGVRIDAPVDVVERCLDQIGFCFCFAPQLHPAMKSVSAVRRSLGVPTIFNLLGPLSNPAGAPFQLLGAGRLAPRDKLAAALRRLGTRRAAVVTGHDGMDEVTITTSTDISLVEGDSIQEFCWSPRDFGLRALPAIGLRAETPEASAALIRRILAGERGAPRDIVLLNAAAALWVAGAVGNLPEGAQQAAEAIDGGAARDVLERLVALSHA